MAEELTQAVALIREGRKQEAQHILLALLKSDPHNDLAWLWLTETIPDEAQRIIALEHCLKINPESLRARQELERLKARQGTPSGVTSPEYPAPGEPSDQAVPAAVPPTPPNSSAPVPGSPDMQSEPPAPKKSRPRVSTLEIILIATLVVLIPSVIGFFWWNLTHSQPVAPLATATLLPATASATHLPPTVTELPTHTPTVTMTPTMIAPAGPGLLYFAGESGCEIRWVSAVDNSSLPVGAIPADLCQEDADHWSIKRWAPDGSLFAMAMIDASQDSAPGAFSIQILRFDGTPVYQLISGSGDIPPAGLSWSPDGSRLAYVVMQETEGGDEVFVLRVVPVDGRQLEESDDLQLTDEHISLEDMTIPGQHISWSPDGQSLALTAADMDKQNGLYRASSTENAFSPLVGNLPMGATVHWSPDGSQIAYNDGLAWKVITPDGDMEQVIVSGEDVDINCYTWLPDSSGLICMVGSGQSFQLVIYKTDGSGEKQVLIENAPLVTTSLFFDQGSSNAHWKSDGSLLAMTALGDSYGLYVLDVNTAGLRSLGVQTEDDFVWATPGEQQPAATSSPTSTPTP